MAAVPLVQPNTPQQSVSSDGYEVFTATTLAGTSPVAVYTAAAAAIRRITKVKKLVVTNPTSGALNVTVIYYRASNTTSYEWYPLQSLASKARLVFDDVEMTLEPSDELRVTESGDGISVFVSTREYQGSVKA